MIDCCTISQPFHDLAQTVVVTEDLTGTQVGLRLVPVPVVALCGMERCCEALIRRAVPEALKTNSGLHSGNESLG